MNPLQLDDEAIFHVARKIEAPEAFSITHSQKLWIYLILLATGLILVEWITYHRRITV